MSIDLVTCMKISEEMADKIMEAQNENPHASVEEARIVLDKLLEDAIHKYNFHPQLAMEIARAVLMGLSINSSLGAWN